MLLHSLKLTTYGALAMIGSLTAYVGILGFGIDGSLSRSISSHHDRDDGRALTGPSAFTALLYRLMASVRARLGVAA